MRSPCSKLAFRRDDPVSFLYGGRGGSCLKDFEDAFCAGCGGGFGGADEGVESRFRSVCALNDVDVGGVDGRGERPEEEGVGWYRRGYTVSVKSRERERDVRWLDYQSGGGMRTLAHRRVRHSVSRPALWLECSRMGLIFYGSELSTMIWM